MVSISKYIPPDRSFSVKVPNYQILVKKASFFSKYHLFTVETPFWAGYRGMILVIALPTASAGGHISFRIYQATPKSPDSYLR
jgi:hypothetical protein